MPRAAYIVLLIAFAVPLLRLLRPLLSGLKSSGLNRSLGFIERQMSRLRGFVVGVLSLILLTQYDSASYGFVALAVGLIALAREQRYHSELRFAEWMRLGPMLWPQDFFYASDLEMGPAGCPAELPKNRERPVPGYDFRSKARSSTSLLPYLDIFFTSAWMTRLIIQAEKYFGPRYYQELFDQGARLWSLMILWVSGCQLNTTGMDKLKELPEQDIRIFVFNHISSTDFAFGFAALDQLIESSRRVRLRFIVAKDHFIDNPLIYSVGGIGRCIELAGMVPIDRKNSENAIASLEAAARQIADGGVDLAIYPQGTRALPHRDQENKRGQAGYYTSAPRRRAAQELGHIKKGTAFLALDVLAALRGTDKALQIVVVGVEGPGKLLPKGRFKMARGVELEYRVSEVIRLTPDEFPQLEKCDDEGQLREDYKAQATELTRRFDKALARACGIKERLEKAHQDLLGRPLPDHTGYQRLFDHLLVLAPAKRAGMMEQLKALQDPTDEALQSLFESLAAIP